MKRILAYGDSNTWGFDPENFDRYSDEIRWTALLQKALGNDALILGEGLNGRTTAFDDPECGGRNGCTALPAILEADRPIDMAIVMLGTNDCKSVFKASAEDITAGMELCLKKIFDYVSPRKVLLICPFYLEEAALNFGNDERSLAVSRELEPAYKELADKYGSAFLAASDVVNASSVDGQHLTAEGHRALCEAVLPILVSMGV
ncbi:MAG: arylesterase [Ruminococcus sp.]|uniref:GDSL-type esterase/lipase family protein n=1 Tax=Ruminococcus sp. TaxID=41978 RepID=UPI002873E171|nr:GDSL-type esterase/lipase family protein [Ruminococcus sp.]MBQ3285034.1 arylesterase [Ruminococcus sp.]